ncbi:unnamed protein product [Discula destructiva]
MPSLSRLFRVKSSLRKPGQPNSPPQDISDVIDDDCNDSSPAKLTTKVRLSNLRLKITAAQAALDTLDELVSSCLDYNTSSRDEVAADYHVDNLAKLEGPSTPAILSIDIHLAAMHRSTEALTAILGKHNTLVASPPSPDLPLEVDLYPAPLRVPLRKSPSTIFSPISHNPMTPVAPSHHFEEIRTFQDWWDEHSLQTPPDTTPYNTPHHHVVPSKRPISLPPPASCNIPTSPATAAFSTEAKTRKLRSLRNSMGSLASLDEEAERPLGMEELMSWLREGNSMRQL